ncbi:MAG: ABC transporter ATP-binding protein [Candidatus Hodarchaeales archaeon]
MTGGRRKLANKAGSTIYSIRDIYKHYTKGNSVIKAIDGINLNINRGSFVAVTGPSGSGKTTLLNLLSGFDKPTSGNIILNGRDITEMKDNELYDVKRLETGTVFQFFYLHEGLNAVQNVEYPMIIAGKKNKPRKIRANQLIDQLGLTNRKEFYPREMSGGEKQRLGIARALANDPPVILADEPTGNLDSNSTEEILNILWKLVKESDKTVIMVTHDLEILSPSNVIINLVDGKIGRITAGNS